MRAAPTKILLIGQNDTLVNNVKKIIPPTFAISRVHPSVEEVSEEITGYLPDIVILCLDMDVELDVEAYAELSSLGYFDNLAVLVLGQVEECHVFENKVFIRGVRIMQRPIKGATLVSVLKKCEEDRENYLALALPEKAPEAQLTSAYRGDGERRQTASEEPLSYRRAAYEEVGDDTRQEEEYDTLLPDDGRNLPKEIIKIPVSRSSAQKLHNDDILRVPPEKGRFFRNAVREKQIKRVQTVFEEERLPEPKKPTHISGKFSVLVVDDDVQLLGAVRKYLQNDYFVTTVPSGKMAYKFVEVNVVDVILLDYLMRDENGPSVFKTLRSNPRTQNTPIIFLTGVSDKERVMNVLSLNPQGYLLKPIQKQELMDTIKKVLE